MPSVYDVQRLVADYRNSEIKHHLHNCDDYIAQPKDSGYRGVHLIYRYTSDKKKPLPRTD
jgi:ppGpp synthetase/RelA/SpoT-type nucleotidyltranferase